MRVISEQIKSLLANKDLSDLKHKVLLYRRKWDTITSTYIIDTTPIEITTELEANNTNGKIKFSLDNDEADVWKVANLTLILVNDRNQFWQGKEDGYFEDPYIIYGSRIEYFIGSPTLDDYVKCFTGYLTESPNYRPDDNLVEIRALSRLDWLNNISAEGVSTTVTDEEVSITDTTHCVTANSAVGRITKVLKGTTLGTAVELAEKTDYSITQLNEYSLGAIITLDSELLAGEKIFASYIYWAKGLKIDELVEDLLDISDIDSAHRIVDPVIFQNASRIANETPLSDAWAWLYQTTDDSLTQWHEGSTASNDYFYWNKGNVTTIAGWGASMKYGSIRFRISKNQNNAVDLNYVYINIGFGANSNQLFILTLGGVGSGGYNRSLHINFMNTGEVSVGTYSDTDTFYFCFDNSNIYFYKNSTVIWTTAYNDFIVNRFRLIVGVGGMIAEMKNLAAKMSTNPFDTNEEWINYQYCRFQYENSEGSFVGFDRLNATISIDGTPNNSILLRYGNSSTDWTEFFEYPLSSAMTLNYDSLDFIIKNTASFGNNYDLSIMKIWSYITQDIPLGVCNLTNMSVYEALAELAAMSAYEIGFDADDKFFFRNRKKSANIKEFTDDKIIDMSKVAYDIDRLVTRVVVNYGGFNKIVDSDTELETQPTNKDKYGNREKSIDGSQLLPADNVDLAYAIAPTIYAELSKLRLTLSIDVLIDLELELGDYVRVLHNNNLLTNKSFNNFTKWSSTGIYYMKCKVVGINTDFNRKITTLDLIDYTEESDYPIAEGKEFMYEFMTEFDLKK